MGTLNSELAKEGHSFTLVLTNHTNTSSKWLTTLKLLLPLLRKLLTVHPKLQLRKLLLPPALRMVTEPLRRLPTELRPRRLRLLLRRPRRRKLQKLLPLRNLKLKRSLPREMRLPREKLMLHPRTKLLRRLPS